MSLTKEQRESLSRFNDGHITEALQTLWICMGIIDEHLLNHPAIIKVNQQDNMNIIFERINEAYQVVGGIEVSEK